LLEVESRVEPRLENGWEADTPLADTLLRQFVFNQVATVSDREGCRWLIVNSAQLRLRA
jgi:hypothetical protein